MGAAGAIDERWKIAGLRGFAICVELFERYIQLVTEGIAGGASKVIEV